MRAWACRLPGTGATGSRGCVGLVLLALFAVPLAARADTLVGENGDRLQGRLVASEDGHYVFDSDAFGRLRIPVHRAVLEAAPVAASPDRQPTPDPAPAPAPWSIELGLDLGADRGSLETRENEFDASLRVVRTGRRGELHGNLAYGYTRTEDRLKDDDVSATVTYDHWLSERHFASWRLVGASELTSEGYDLTRTAGVAWGWRLFERPDRYLRIGPAAGYLWIERGPESFQGSALGLYARGKGPVAGRITYDGELQWLDSFDDGGYANLLFRLQHPLARNLKLGLVWRYVWNDVDVESGVSSEWRWELTWRPGDGGR